jgi:nitrile hydratase
MTVRPHDLGGRHGFGPVPIEQDEPVFHGEWEASVIAGILATIAAGLYNVDQFREGIDDLEPLSYLTLGYYRRWLHTLEVNCVKSGVFSYEQLERRIEEIAAGAEQPAGKDSELAESMRNLIYFSAPSLHHVDAPPAYAVGDSVRGRVLEGARHARIPVYAQGKRGTVLCVGPAFPDPDTNRTGQGERPEYVYSVAFAGRELWPDGDESSEIVVDLWESYLEPVPEGVA